MTIQDAINFTTRTYNDCSKKRCGAREIMDKITDTVIAHDFSVADRVTLSNHILSLFKEKERIDLCKALLNEQVYEQRISLNKWMTITAQSSQIDTGYIAQHLVSLRTQIAGQGMRGKGDDLCDGSEVKSANFLDSLDKNGAVSPRWNFTAITPAIMERFLTYETLYLLDMDLDPSGKIRIRIWQVDVTKNDLLKQRYNVWMELKGRPKFNNNNNESVNFQLFPPHNGTNDTYARHGSARTQGMPPIQIDLNDGVSTKLIFYAIQQNKDFEVIFY